MDRLDVARARLAEALENLEKTAKSRVESQGAAAQTRMAALEAERERLQARIAELEDELAALGSASAEVEHRLDGAIGEIRAALVR